MDSLRPTSLRAAVITANHGGNNTIILEAPPVPRGPHLPIQPRVYHLSIRGANELDGRTGDLDITSGNLTIQASGPGVIIDASELGDRLFYVGPRATLQLTNLTLRGGNPPGFDRNTTYTADTGSRVSLGGAIFNAGTIILQDCTLTNNISGTGGTGEQVVGGVALESDGGAIYNSGMARLTRCLLIGNRCGNAGDTSNGGCGGAICNEQICSLSDCQIIGNQAGDGWPIAYYNGWVLFAGHGGSGGGVCSLGGSLFLTNCYIADNRAGIGLPGGALSTQSFGEYAGSYWPGSGGTGGDGGGIANYSALKVWFSTFYNNRCGDGGVGGSSVSGAGNGGNGGNGGGLYNIGNASINSCTFCENMAGNGAVGGDCLTPIILNEEGPFSTLGGNGGNAGNGGGIYDGGTLTMASSTVAGNQTGAGANGGNGYGDSHIHFYDYPSSFGGNGGIGGGVYSWYNFTGSYPYECTALTNCLIAFNEVQQGGLGGTNYPFFYTTNTTVAANGNESGGYDVYGYFISGGFNLISTGDNSSGFTNSVNADQVGTDNSPIDPLLGPLQMNGGLTPTMALLTNSPAIDQGNCFGINQDQRGYYRPYVHPFIVKPAGGDGSDIGAYEQIPGK